MTAVPVTLLSYAPLNQTTGALMPGVVASILNPNLSPATLYTSVAGTATAGSNSVTIDTNGNLFCFVDPKSDGTAEYVVRIPGQADVTIQAPVTWPLVRSAVQRAFDVTAYGADPTGATDSTTAFQAACDAAAAAGGGIVYGVGTFKLGALTWKSNVSFQGGGRGTATTLVAASGTTGMFQLAGRYNCHFHNFQVNCQTQQTAGSIFNITSSSFWITLDTISIFSPYQGITIDSSSNVRVTNVWLADFNATWPWNYGVGITGNSTDVSLRDVSGGYATGTAGMAKAFIWLSGIPTSIRVDNSQVATPGVLGMLVDNASLLFVTGCEFEGGTTANGLTISNICTGSGLHFIGCHFLGAVGVLVAGGQVVEFSGGHIVKCYLDGMRIFGGNNCKVHHMDISDVSQQANNTSFGIWVAAGVSGFEITDNTIGKRMLLGNGNIPAWGVAVTAGASDKYRIQRNRTPDSTNTTNGGISDGGTGANKVVSDNVAW